MLVRVAAEGHRRLALAESRRERLDVELEPDRLPARELARQRDELALDRLAPRERDRTPRSSCPSARAPRARRSRCAAPRAARVPRRARRAAHERGRGERRAARRLPSTNEARSSSGQRLEHAEPCGERQRRCRGSRQSFAQRSSPRGRSSEERRARRARLRAAQGARSARRIAPSPRPSLLPLSLPPGGAARAREPHRRASGEVPPRR